MQLISIHKKLFYMLVAPVVEPLPILLHIFDAYYCIHLAKCPTLQQLVHKVSIWDRSYTGQHVGPSQ